VARDLGLVVRAAATCQPIYVLIFAVLFTLALTLMEGVTWAVVDVRDRRRHSRESGRLPMVTAQGVSTGGRSKPRR
jgi:hypothetical protein